MITPRQEALLVSIIEAYVNTAEPVSSKLLEKSGFFGLSSATIRAEMNDLEEAGYLAHLYTSSGRVPTQRAYRYFVDTFIQPDECQPDATAKRRVSNTLNQAERDPRELNRTVAQLIADLSDTMVITNVSESEDFFKVGISSLFEFPEFQELQKVFQLTEFFDHFEHIFADLERVFQPRVQEIQIFIGHENPLKPVKDETVMFARYALPGNYTGSVTLVGPMRMDYRKNIGLIKYTIDELNRLAR